MSPTSSLLHALKDQMRSVKYSIRAEAHMPGSTVPLALQSREVRRLTTLGGVVSKPAFRLVDGIVTRFETMAMDWLGGASRGGVAVEPIETYLAGEFDVSDKLFVLVKRIVDSKDRPNVFVSEHALDGAAAAIAKSAAEIGAGERDDPALPAARVAEALACADPVRRVGYRPGEPDGHFGAAPSLYCGLVAGLMIAVASARPSAAEDGAALLESADSAVNARFDRFRRAMDAEDRAGAIATEFRKLIPFLP